MISRKVLDMSAMQDKSATLQTVPLRYSTGERSGYQLDGLLGCLAICGEQTWRQLVCLEAEEFCWFFQ